jgi:hypothetical protein
MAMASKLHPNMAVSLKDLSSYKPRGLQALATIDKISKKPFNSLDERGDVLIAVSLVEQLLEEVILARCIKTFESSPWRSRLFGGGYSSLAAKIVLGHALGLYGQRFKEDLDRLREIRNVFAHSRVDLTLKSPAIGDPAIFICFKMMMGLNPLACIGVQDTSSLKRAASL